MSAGIMAANGSSREISGVAWRGMFCVNSWRNAQRAARACARIAPPSMARMATWHQYQKINQA